MPEEKGTEEEGGRERGRGVGGEEKGTEEEGGRGGDERRETGRESSAGCTNFITLYNTRYQMP